MLFTVPVEVTQVYVYGAVPPPLVVPVSTPLAEPKQLGFVKLMEATAEEVGWLIERVRDCAQVVGKVLSPTNNVYTPTPPVPLLPRRLLKVPVVFVLLPAELVSVKEYGALPPVTVVVTMPVLAWKQLTDVVVTLIVKVGG